MMPILKVIVLVLTLCIYTSQVYGDDGSFEGDGANVYPIKNSGIQMVSETILMKHDNKRSEWFVDVTMNFHNHGPATSVQMGFPFKEPYGTTDMEDDAKFIAHKKREPAYEFKSYVDGKQVSTTTKKGVLNPKLPKDLFEKVMTFTVPFEASENKSIRHTYYIGGDMSSNGVRLLSYILRTGALWRDVIQSCEIQIEMPERLASVYHVVTPKEHKASISGETITLYWHFTNIKPDFDIQLEAIQTDIINFNSEELLKYMQTYQMNLESKYIRYFRNRIHAKYGRKFENPYIKAQFIDMSGQDGNTKYSPQLMTPKDKELLQFLNFMDRERVPN